jgi:hypothetical protein
MTDARGEGDSGRQPSPGAIAGESRAPAPLTPESLRAALERTRGRPLIVAAVPMPPGRPAMWIGTACCDYILYEPSLPPSRQVWAVACQAGHMLAGHRGNSAGEDVAASLFPGLDPAVVTVELPAPAAFTTAEVQEAEALAAVLVTRITPTAESVRQPPLSDEPGRNGQLLFDSWTHRVPIVDHISSRKVDETISRQSSIGGAMSPTSEATFDDGAALARVPWRPGREGAL